MLLVLHIKMPKHNFGAEQVPCMEFVYGIYSGNVLYSCRLIYLLNFLERLKFNISFLPMLLVLNLIPLSCQTHNYRKKPIPTLMAETGALKSRDLTRRHHIARVDIARSDNPAPCPLRWFRLPSVLCLDVEENDLTVRESVPTSTTAGAAIRTDVCDGELWGGVSGEIFPR